MSKAQNKKEIPMTNDKDQMSIRAHRSHKRIQEWKKQACNYNDAYLEKLKKAMLDVFCEESPVFTIDKKKRSFVTSDKKKTHYSDKIRRGLAIELAIIGNNYDLMKACSKNKRELFASDVIQHVFSGMTWKRLASLDSVIPFFAEASPNAFLNEIISLIRNRIVFQQLKDDESDNWFNRESHFVGITQALETLAWEPEYLFEVVSIAASLSCLDNENSNLHPRPKDFFLGLFCPWNPQTVASDEQLIETANFLALQNPELAWKVLSDAIVSCLGAYHRVPKVRETIPSDCNTECTTENDRRNSLVPAYTKILLDTAESNVSIVPKLVQKIHLFSETIFWERALSIITFSKILRKNDRFKESLWANLRKFCIKNRLYRDTEWAMAEDRLKEIDKVVELLKPQSLIFQKRYLFDDSISDWYGSHDYSEEEAKFTAEQNSAIKAVYSQEGINGIIALSQIVNNSFWLGGITATTNIIISKRTIASLLDDSREPSKSFIRGYLRQQYNQKKDAWLTSFQNVKWSIAQKVSFSTSLPLSSSVCHFAETWLGENESLFWKDYQPGFISPQDTDRSFVIQKAMNFNRPDIAVKLFSWLHFEKITIDFDLCSKALLELSRTSYIKDFKHWEITQLIVELQAMQKSDKQKNELMKVEFCYLPLLDPNLHNNLSPATLYSALAEDPEFFHQVITYAYKSKIPEKTLQVNDGLAKSAFSLMFQWNKMPGVINGTLNYDAFTKWYKKAIELCEESGHLRVAQTHIGETLYKTPKDSSGFWIDKRIAALLNEEGNDALRNGYHCAVFNSRGVRVVDFSGKREYEAAEEQNRIADELEKNGFTNFAQVFRDLAQIYEKEAESAIKDGERFKKQDTDDL